MLLEIPGEELLAPGLAQQRITDTDLVIPVIIEGNPRLEGACRHRPALGDPDHAHRCRALMRTTKTRRPSRSTSMTSRSGGSAGGRSWRAARATRFRRS